jgi:hypothetical protein
MVIYILIFSFLGFFKPETRGSIFYAMIITFVLLSFINGYVSSTFLKMVQVNFYTKFTLLINKFIYLYFI